MHEDASARIRVHVIRTTGIVWKDTIKNLGIFLKSEWGSGSD